MKWIRWDGVHWFDWRNTAPDSPYEQDYTGTIDEGRIDCEKDKNWREIESGVLDTETGKLCITLKPVPKVPTLREAVEEYLENAWSNYRVAADAARKNVPNDYLVRLVDALDRESSTPANPYTKEAVEELLEAAEKADSQYFRESCWVTPGFKRMVRALVALKNQREAANGG